jgi:PAS domain S-box-containing protein
VFGRAIEGIPQEESEYLEIVHPADRPWFTELSKQLNDQPRDYDCEYRVRRSDGTFVWLREIAEVVRDSSGEIVGMVGTDQDITDLKRGEEALRESEARLRSFMDHAPFIAYLKDSEGRFVLVNREFQRVEQRPEPDFLGKTAYDVVPRDEADAWTASDNIVLSKGDIVVRELSQSRLKDYSHTLNVKFPVRDATGRIIGIGGFSQDITERKRVELALRESESRLRRAQQQVRLAYWTWQLETEEYHWAPGAGLILGVADRDLPQTEAGYFACIHPEDRERMKRLYDKITNGQDAFNHEFRIQRPDGGIIWVREIGEVEHDASGRRVSVAGTIQDITSQRNLEEQLRQSQKMEAIGQLTGGIAHDFNNLLAVILGNLELVTEQIGDNKKLAKGIDNAVKASLRGADLTQRLLAFARRQALAPIPTDVNKLIASMRDLITRPLGPNVEFSTVLGKGIWPIEIDHAQLESAVLNMALNARDAMPDGGRLTIETTNTHVAEDADMLFGELRPGDYVLISVSDTGSGMNDEVKARAFDPFYTTKSLGKGTGLGLSMVYGFVKQSGGHIRIDSEVGVGTSMRIYLPRAQSVAAMPESESAAAAPKARGETIMVLEDEAEVATVAQRYLVRLGYKVILAEDAETAMAKLSTTPHIDLLLADIILGGKRDGRAVAKEAVARWPHLKIMFMSGYAPNGGPSDGTGDEPAVHISKPFRKSELARQLRRVLDRSSGR